MTYQYLKLLHIFAVIMFLGNITTGLFWMRFAVKTKDWKVINHTMKGIILSDKIFTLPGILLIVAGGIMAAIHAHLPLLKTGWIFWSLILFSVSGIIYMWKVGPLQRKIAEYTSQSAAGEEPAWPVFHKKYIQWELWGLLALLTPFAALVLMVLKIPA
jgi:uncharacterized membrane protein